MKVLQLFNNWKWTGPAEYAFNLAWMLNKNGIDTVFACSPPPKEANESLYTIAKERGLVPFMDFTINKHFRFWDNVHDFRQLVRFINEKKITVIHAHLTNGHLLGALAARKTPLYPVVVRTCYDNNGGGMRDRLLYKRLTDGIIAVAHSTKRAILDKCPIPPGKVRVISAAIDTHRFNPHNGLKDNRIQWQIEPDMPVVGIVARVQKHRRFNLFLEGMAKAITRVPNLKVMVIGRGTRIKELAIEPVKKMGLEKHFIFTGYRKDDYVETLNCLDIKVFLVPGSDESCRAVREAMALGKPVIVSRKGMLPEIVEDTVNGLVIKDDPDSLAQAVIELVEDKVLREKLGKNALQKAHTEFSLEKQFKSIVEFYEELIRKKSQFREVR